MDDGIFTVEENLTSGSRTSPSFVQVSGRHASLIWASNAGQALLKPQKAGLGFGSEIGAKTKTVVIEDKILREEMRRDRFSELVLDRSQPKGTYRKNI